MHYRLQKRRGCYDHRDHLSFLHLDDTDEDTKQFLTMHGRPDAYKELNPADVAYYDGVRLC